MEKKDIPARHLSAASLKHYLHLKAELDSALRNAEQSKQKLFTAARESGWSGKEFYQFCLEAGSDEKGAKDKKKEYVKFLNRRG
jgi:hypothetical protein